MCPIIVSSLHTFFYKQNVGHKRRTWEKGEVPLAELLRGWGKFPPPEDLATLTINREIIEKVCLQGGAKIMPRRGKNFLLRACRLK